MMQYRVTIEYRGGSTGYRPAEGYEDMARVEEEARRDVPPDWLLTTLTECLCPEHGWSYCDEAGCSECLDEYYHPVLDDCGDDDPYSWAEKWKEMMA